MAEMIDALDNIKVISATLPKGRMKGDVDGDGVIAENDYKLILQAISGTTSLDDIQNWCGDVDNSGKADSSDSVLLMNVVAGRETVLTSVPTMADYYGNWTWVKIDDLSGYFYYDIPVATATIGSTAALATSDDADMFIDFECRDGSIRVYAKRLPLESTEISISVDSEPTNKTSTLIGNQYSNNRVYRGIRHYDHLPITSEDIHEYADTVYMKTAYIMNNILGCGILNTPSITTSGDGISLSEPAVLLVNGDVSLIQSDDNTPLVSKSAIATANHSSGTVCIVGWYQHLLATSKMRNYGGVYNSIIPNTLLDNELNIQLSTRYQFRWMPVLIATESISSDTITFDIESLREDGSSTGDVHTIIAKKDESIFKASAPSSMTYSLSGLYVIPLLKYSYSSSSGTITGTSPYLPVKPKGGSSGFIKSDSEPIGDYAEGTTWYNPLTREFKTYVEGVGFVDSASTMGFLQYQSVYTVPNTIYEEQDIVVPIEISELQEGDILQVVYEGLVLSLGEHYTVDYRNNTVKLLGFTVNAGEKITFTATKIVEASDITNVTLTFTSHMATTSSSTVEGHVKLSDYADDLLTVDDGVAATPKAVYQSRLIKDNTNNINYKFGVENGLLYLEEV